MKPSTKNLRIEDLSSGQRPYGDTHYTARLHFWQTWQGSDEIKPWTPNERTVKAIAQAVVQPFKETDDPTRIWADAFLSAIEKETEDTFVIRITRPFTD